MRTCEVTQCSNFVFGTDKNTRVGYCRNHQTLRTDISHESIMQRALKKQRQNASIKTQSQLRNLAYENPEIKGSKDYKSKSELLREADRAFADFIKARDMGNNGTIYCPCCNKVFGHTEADINCMHFVDRDVYSLRFDEDNAHMGHAVCNRNQHYNPKGKEYQNFRNYLVDKLTENEVKIMELEHRKINKITEQQLKTVIEHYSTINT